MTDNTGHGYYYLFLSYGYYNANGGYNMRVFRSENPDGPYIDENGNSAIYTSDIYPEAVSNAYGTVGQRLMSNYQWDENSTVYKAQGHNSAFQDSDGNLYLIYHTKFDDDYGFHEVRVHQMFLNEDGWLTVAPYEYSGEEISETGYDASTLTGKYQFLFHRLDQSFVNEVSAEVETPVSITLLEDGTVTGDATGTWTYRDNTPYMTITIDGVTYKGEFLVQADESASQTQRMTFTATANNTCVWGSKVDAYDAVLAGVDITNTDSALTYNAGTSSFENGDVYIAGTSLLSDVSYTITSKSSNLVLERNGDNVQQWERNGWNGQEWRIVDLGNGYCKIVNMQDEALAISVENGSTADGANICLTTYTGNDAQQWKIIDENGYYGIVSKSSGDTAGLDVYGWSTEFGGNIDQWSYWSGDCQLWSITPVYPAVPNTTYLIRSENSGLFLGNDNGNIIQSSEQTPINAVQNNDGTYALYLDNLALTVENNNADDGNNISLSAYTGSDAQKFYLYPTPDGSYAILSLCSNRVSCLDVYEISLNVGANICQWSYWGGVGQKWVLIPTEEVALNPVEETTTTEEITTTTTEETTTTVEETTTELTTMPTETTTETTPLTPTLLGDVTLDNVIDLGDVVLLARHLATLTTLSPQQECNADCYDKNGTLDFNDLSALIDLQLHIIDSLPVIDA